MPIFFLLIVMLFAFSACGDDSGSSADSTDSELESSSGKKSRSSSSGSLTSATTIIDSDAKDIHINTPIDDEFVDSITGDVYKIRTLGIYTWTTENINIKNFAVKSTCYAYDDSNCKPYGRLYMLKNAEKMCPAGYSIPTISDWEYIKKVHPKSFSYAGICFKRDTLECSAIGDSAQYLAYGNYAIVVDSLGHFSQIMSNERSFYSLRCIKYRTIVQDTADLPDCNQDGYYNYPSIYVASKKLNYICSNGEWVASNGVSSCQVSEEGEKYLIDSLVYICKSGLWKLTTPEDAGVKCTKKNFHEEYVVNGVRYACMDTGMVRLPFPESELGLCTPKLDGTFAKTDSVTYYICDSTRWIVANITDVLGECDSTRQSKIGTFKNESYTCHGTIWQKSSQVELDFGGCTNKLQDSVRQDERGYIYTCINNYWKQKSSEEILGACQTDNNGSISKFGPNTYICTDYAWDPLDALDSALGNCTKENLADRSEYKGASYFCKYSNQYEWSKATDEEERLGYCPNKKTFTTEVDGILYKCDFGTWMEADLTEALSNCNSDEGITKIYKGTEYVCDTTAYNNKGQWYAMTTIDSILGEYCRSAIFNKAVMHGNDVYVCRKGLNGKANYWGTGTIADYLGKCTKDRLGARGFNGIDTCVCVDNVCNDNRKTNYTYNGKDTNVCVNVNNGYNWVPIIRDSIVDKRDSEVYGVLTFGTQKWLNRELHYTLETAYSSEGYLLTHYPEEFLHTYYYYYTWDDAFGNGSDICPEGTHIPSEAEWTTLFDYVSTNLTTEGFDVLFSISRNNSTLTNLYGLSLKRRGFVDMDYFGPREGAPTNMTNPLNANLAGNDDISNMFYWITGSGNSSSTGNVVHADSNSHISYEDDALKVDAYMIRCILD